MAKFNKASSTATVLSPITTTRKGRTSEGGDGYTRDAKSELFLLAVTNMVGENTFYEAANVRDERFRDLVQTVALEDADWIARFIPWLRGEANMRSASIVVAVESVRARLQAGLAGGNRELIAAACRRADEPGEVLAYWTARFGRAVPKPVKRGVADAVERLYNERSLAKYDSDAKGYRFADVIEITHPSPSPDKPWQGDLFSHALDRRHHRDKPIPNSLRTLTERAELLALPVGERRSVLLSDGGSQRLADAGMTWEALAGWLQGPMDADAWSAMIPSMGLMALARNLRNFDNAGVSDELAEQIAAKFADADEVARSRMLPFRWLSAYRAAPSLRWAYPLEQALGHSLTGIPELRGRTLILVDTSGSMAAGFSRDGTLMRWDAAALFGIALAHRCGSADVVSFSNGTKVFPQSRGESVLRALARWKDGGYFFGGGTEAAKSLREHYARHDRVVIVTDEQAAYDARGGVTGAVPAKVPVFTWNLAGYATGHAPSGSGNRHVFGGLSDQAFKMIPLLETEKNAPWPF